MYVCRQDCLVWCLRRTLRTHTVWFSHLFQASSLCFLIHSRSVTSHWVSHAFFTHAEVTESPAVCVCVHQSVLQICQLHVPHCLQPTSSVHFRLCGVELCCTVSLQQLSFFFMTLLKVMCCTFLKFLCKFVKYQWSAYYVHLLPLVLDLTIVSYIDTDVDYSRRRLANVCTCG